MPFAHSANEDGIRHNLVDHLRAVAERAAEFAAPLDAAEMAHWIGLWHDLGKFHPRFQRYLLESEADPSRRGHGPDHKAAGSRVAQKHLGLACLLIQGHHGGLRSPNELRSWLAEPEGPPALDGALDIARRAIPGLEPEHPPHWPEHVRSETDTELYLRLLFSALVDADFLDTERHFNAGRTAERRGAADLSDLLERFNRDQAQFSTTPTTVVGQARAAIYEACVRAAEQPPGIFHLTVPTGGGKTRSAMAFALRHAARHGMRRVIVAVPFISITEQTAEIYRDIFGDDPPVVLEHHSGVGGEESAEGDFHHGAVWERLAAENWDAPIIVTTTVQLFESLFARRPKRLRKLHRLANSVLILDEAQALPAHLLKPALDVLQQLAAHYGTTVVLSTATQPAFEAIPTFASVDATEIVPDPGRWFETLRRVTYEWRVDPAPSWDDIADIMRSGPQSLAVLNTKPDTTALLDALDDPDALHLSTSLCGAHRRAVIADVKRRLAAGEPCRLISTQVVEAGVDIDFPTVLRAVGPLDGIIQAAGRCNREGRLRNGRVIVFKPAGERMPSGAYRTAADVTGAVLGAGVEHPDTPEVLHRYFRQLFDSVDTDRERIQPLRASFDYPEVTRRFRMIEDDTESVVVTQYGNGRAQQRVRDLLDQLRHGTPDGRRLLRQLQPYIVSVRSRAAEHFRRQGLITDVTAGLGEWHGRYDRVRGITGESADPDALIV